MMMTRMMTTMMAGRARESGAGAVGGRGAPLEGGDEGEGDDDAPSIRTVHCRLTPKLWSDAKRAELDAACDAIANLLVKADEILARIALGEAKETPVNDRSEER